MGPRWVPSSKVDRQMGGDSEGSLSAQEAKVSIAERKGERRVSKAAEG